MPYIYNATLNTRSALVARSNSAAMAESAGSVFYRKFLIFFIGVFLPAWTLSKVPLYLAFDDQGTDAYDARGLGGSINLEQWVEGFRSSKLHSPACNFLLVHIAFGITVLVMMALTIYNVAWRRKYGYVLHHPAGALVLERFFTCN